MDLEITWPPKDARELFPGPRQQVQNVAGWLIAANAQWNFGPSFVEEVLAVVPVPNEPTLDPLRGHFLVLRGPSDAYDGILGITWNAMRAAVELEGGVAMSLFGPDLELITATDDQPRTTDRWSFEWVDVVLTDHRGIPAFRSARTGAATGSSYRAIGGAPDIFAVGAHCPQWIMKSGVSLPAIVAGQSRWQYGGTWVTPHITSVPDGTVHLGYVTGGTCQPTIEQSTQRR
jgi:hypothetical protein